VTCYKCWVILAMVLTRRLGCSVMSMPSQASNVSCGAILLLSHAGDDAAEVILTMVWCCYRVMLMITLPSQHWPWYGITAESCWRWHCLSFCREKKGGQSLLSPGITEPESDVSADSEHATSFLSELARLSRPGPRGKLHVGQIFLADNTHAHEHACFMCG
jgi:hypothetical protein